MKSVSEKIVIEESNGKQTRVRPKDVVVIHPGPADNVPEIRRADDDLLIQTWELMAGEQTTLSDVAELAYGEFTPVTASSTWTFIIEQPYFTGTPNLLQAATPDAIKRLHERERERASADRARFEFLQRLANGTTTVEDRGMFGEIEAFALGRSQALGLMRDLRKKETEEEAHALLLDAGIWDGAINPYPARAGLGLDDLAEDIPMPDLAGRRDLTKMICYAIDDEDTTTPDDAISWHDNALWIHVADAAALAPPGSGLDVRARAKGATLYLPDRVFHMMPEKATERLGLGISDVSPALSFKIAVDELGVPKLEDIAKSMIRVERCSYRRAEEMLEESPLCEIDAFLRSYRERRFSNGAVRFSLPEVRIRVGENHRVDIDPLYEGESRFIVQEAMVVTGEAVARWAMKHQIPIPFSTQQSGEIGKPPVTLSEMWSARKKLRRSEIGTTPGFHASLGIPFYSQSTSPLRRYQDLLTHQQVSTFLEGKPALGTDELMSRLGETLDTVRLVRRVETLSNRHWTMVYLMQHPGWTGDAVVVEVAKNGCICMISELGHDVKIHQREKVSRDDKLKIKLEEVNLPYLEATFSVV